jgi:hypothetical protein
MSKAQKSKSQPKNRSGNKRRKDVRYPSTWILDLATPFPRVDQFADQVYNFVDTVQTLAAFTTATVTTSGVGWYNALNLLTDYTEYSAVFDQYRIMAIKHMITPSAATPVAGLTGHLHTVIDYDDDAAITPAQTMNYSNCIISNLTDTVVRTYTPKLDVALYGGAFTSFGNMGQSMWIDCASPGVRYYGLKIAADPTTTAISYDFVITYWVQFRNQR